jgi:hypothetical protein
MYLCVCVCVHMYNILDVCIYIHIYICTQESFVAARKQSDEDAAALAISAAEERVRRLQEEGAKRVATLLEDLGRETEIRQQMESAVLTLEEQVANARAEVLYGCMFVCVYVGNKCPHVCMHVRVCVCTCMRIETPSIHTHIST